MATSGTLWDSLDASEADPAQASDACWLQHRTPAARMSYRQWTERLAAHPSLVTARELAGLADDRLSALATEYEQGSRSRHTAWLKVGAGVSATGAALGVTLGTLRETGDETLAALALAFVLAGVVGATVVGWMYYVGSGLEQAHRRLGLVVGALDEQHPWLYRAMLLLRHPQVEAYRIRTLAERGVLRGVDYLLMREIAQAHERLELTQTANAVVARLQGAETAGHRTAQSHAAAAAELQPVAASAAAPSQPAVVEAVPPSRLALTPAAA